MKKGDKITYLVALQGPDKKHTPHTLAGIFVKYLNCEFCEVQKESGELSIQQIKFVKPEGEPNPEEPKDYYGNIPSPPPREKGKRRNYE